MTLRTITFDDEQWQVVPKDATDEMLAATSWPGCAATDYAHMLAAAPEPPAQESMTVAEIEDQSSYWHHWYLKAHEELYAVRQGWIRVIDEFLVTRHLGIASPTDTYDEARAKLIKIIDFEIDIATDPVVGGDRVRKGESNEG